LTVSFSSAFEWVYLRPNSLRCEITRLSESKTSRIHVSQIVFVISNFYAKIYKKYNFHVTTRSYPIVVFKTSKSWYFQDTIINHQAKFLSSHTFDFFAFHPTSPLLKSSRLKTLSNLLVRIGVQKFHGSFSVKIFQVGVFCYFIFIFKFFINWKFK
jgi:hypothetical protein